METNDTHKTRLAELVRDLAVQHGKFTLASGKQSTFYVDMRRATLHHEAAPLIGHVMLDLLEQSGFTADDIDAVGGMTMGADPVATAILHAAASRGLDIDAFVVRKSPKDHGMGRQVEGPEVAGRNVVILEDTSTTGGSPLQAIAALRAAGANVLAVAVVADRATGAKERIEAEGVPYLAALTLDDLGLANEPQPE
ncbi:MAG: orotate phosphoribosyltransferase [Varibaculum sp.]|nr:orotate phosphoribosyltransferase [Varibaculum sp.]